MLLKANRRKSKINFILDCRVRERTIELGLQRDELQHAMDEDTIARRRMAEEVVALSATLKGILHLGWIELPGGIRDYFKLAEAHADQIVRAIEQYKSSSKVKA